jgi:protein gp37
VSTSTAIQWTDVTDNIIVVEGGGWWCRMISPGCMNCYAAKLNQSAFFGGNKRAYKGEAPTMVLRPEICDGWAKQTKPKRHFVASMTDVFGEWVTQNQVDYFLYSMLQAPKQTFQVLTKRPDVAKHCIDIWLDGAGLVKLPPNVWLGVSVEDQKRADERIPVLLSIPAKVRFLSVEPMLGAVHLDNWFWQLPEPICPSCPRDADCGCGFQTAKQNGRPSIDWVIVGGESGARARPCDVQWVTNIVYDCRVAGCPVFVKQLGACAATDESTSDGWPAGTEFDVNCITRIKLKHPKGGDMAEWPEDLRVRDFPAT